MLQPQDDTPLPPSKLRAIAAKIAFATSFFGIVLGALAVILKNYTLS